MNNVRINQIVQKRTRVTSKKGAIEIKFRSAFKNPLTDKRREIVSEWYEVKQNYDDNGKVVNLRYPARFFLNLVGNT